MIGVIADDLTGAAEIGAVGLRHGLRAEVVIAGEPSDDADLVCLDTDSRACAPGEAAQRAAHAASLLNQRHADWIYKKTDSVLRGNVTPELEAIVSQLGLAGALLVPANPSLGRTIVNAQYFVRGRLIHQTEFARDPQHPRLSPNVRELLDQPTMLPLSVRQPNEVLPERGIVIGEVTDSEALRKWAALRNQNWLMAGGAEFFGALLKAPISSFQPKSQHGKELFACGSASEATRNFVAGQAKRGVSVFSLPAELLAGAPFDAARIQSLAAEIVTAFRSTARVILHVGLPPVSEVSLAEMLALHLVRVAGEVLQRTEVHQVFVEGGATAVALARCLGWNRLRVMAELAPGVVTLSAVAGSLPVLTIKPGSYVWPEAIANA